MAKIITDSGLTEQLASGSAQLANILRPNYGPNGKNTIYDQQYDIPLIINTGKKILQQFGLADNAENIGAVLLRDAALTSDSLNGDGTITTVIVADTIISEGNKLIAAGANPIRLRSSLKKVLPLIERMIKAVSIPADTPELLLQAATIAADDEKLGQLVADAFMAVGTEGIVSVIDSQESANRLEISNGIKYDYGLASSSFVTDTAKQLAFLENPRILLLNQKLSALPEIEKILNEVINTNVSLFIIAKDIDEQLMNILLANVYRQVFRVAVGKAPGYGDTCTRNMQALAAKTGAALIEENRGLNLADCGLEICGYADSVTIDKNHTLIQGLRHENKDAVLSIKKQVNEQLAHETKDYEIEKLNDTMAILSSRSAILVAGGFTEYEMFENKHQLENAVSAVYSAAHSGLSAGGGKALLLAIPMIDRAMADSEEEDLMALLCIRKALTAPARIIAENAGENGDHILSLLLKQDNDPFWGYDAADHSFKDLKAAGILDPTSTILTSFFIGVEIAATLLTVSAAVLKDD